MSFQRILGAVVLGILSARAGAQVLWLGSVDSNFSTPANWSSTPLNNGTDNLAFSGAVAANPVVNLNVTANSLTYQSGTSSFTLTSSGGSTLTLQSLAQNSANYQTLAAPLVLGSGFTFSGPGTSTVLNLTGSITGSNGFTVGGGLDLRVGGSWAVAGPLTVQSGSALEFVGANFTLNNAITNNGAIGFGDGTNTLSYSGVIAGSGSVTVNSATTLTAQSTYSGGTTIANAMLTLGTANALPASTAVQLTNAAGSKLNLNSYNVAIGSLSGGGAAGGEVMLGSATLTTGQDNSTTTFAGIISGAGGLTKTGSGTMTLSGANTFTGGTAVTGGALAISTDANLGQAPAATTPGALALSGGGTLQTTATMTLASNRGLAVGAGGGTLLTDVGTTLTYGGQIAAPTTRTLTKGGAGTLVLTGANTYNGNTQVAAGTLVDGAAGAYSPYSTFSVASGANLTVNASETIYGLNDSGGSGGSVSLGTGATLTVAGSGMFSGVISGAGGLSIQNVSGMNQTLSGTNTYTGGTSIGPNATLQIGLGGTSGSITGSVTNNGSLVYSRSNGVAASGISGTGAVQQMGSGTLTFSGLNSYTGPTFINNGTIADAGTNALASSSVIQMYGGNVTIGYNETIGGLGDWMAPGLLPGNVTVATGATLKITGGSSFSGEITGGGALRIANGANETLQGNVTLVGSTTIDSGGALQIGNATTTGAITGTIVDNGYLTFKRADAVAYGGLSGSGTVTQAGAGMLTLTGTNTYTGPTFVTGGTLTDGAAGAFSPQSSIRLTAAGATLNVANAETISGLGGASNSVGTTTNLGATLTINNGNLAYNGLITGAGGLVLNGSGSQTLGGANTYTGGTTVNGGFLIAMNTSGSATGTGPVTIASGATLQLGASGPGGAVSGNINNNGTVLFASTDSTASYGGVISGGGALNIGLSGSTGTLTLTGASTYTGQTFLNSGTLRLGTANALPVSTALAFGNSGTLDVAANQTVASLNSDYSATVSLQSGATLTVAPATGAYGGTFAGTMTGAGSLAFAGASDTGMTLTGTNTYSGGTLVSSGTIHVGSSSALGSGAVTVASGGALGLSKSSGDLTLSNAVSLASGATLGTGTGTYLLGITGAVQVASGASTVHVGQYVQFGGAVAASTGTAQLTIDSAAGGYGHALFTGSIDASVTSLTASNAGVLFGPGSVPAAGALALRGTNAYVGVASMSGEAPTVASVLVLIDKPSFTGVLGFDTPARSGAPAVFADAIDVSGFGTSLTLGSASSAVLAGTITPAAGGYQFGNGGGALAVNSTLTGTNNVTVSSVTGIPGNHLLAVLRGANDFTGALTVDHSLVVLDSATALPATGTVSLGSYGYLGYTEAFTRAGSFGSFAALVPNGSYTATSVLGVDSTGYILGQLTSGSSTDARGLADPIDLRAFSTIYLGTATRAELQGTIYAPNQGGANRTLSLLAARDALLSVPATLMAGQVNAVVVGASGSPYASGGVLLGGANTYAGGTTLQSGTLLVDGSSAAVRGVSSGPLGTGTVKVAAGAQKVVLAAASSYSVLNNNLAIGSRLRLGFPYLGASDTPSWASLYSYNALVLNGVIGDLDGSNPGSLQLYGFTTLNGANTFSGGVTLEDGILTLGNDAALGSGTLTIATGADGMYYGTALTSYSGARTLGNAVVYAGQPDGVIMFNGTGGFTFTGGVTLMNDVSLSPYSYPVSFTGPISGMGRLTGSYGSVYLSGANTYSGGTKSLYGNVVFASTASIPLQPTSNALLAEYSGYIGLASIPNNLQTDFINRFDRGTTGAIGFDSASVAAPNTFSGSINLSAFNGSTRLGSSSRAILTGAITPFGTAYRFGNGGGLLEVGSALTDSGSARSLEVESDSVAPLTLRLTGTNTFTGGISVTNSGVIFTASSLPATGTITPYTRAYIGTEDPAAFSSPTAFTSRIASVGRNFILGFDSFSGSANVSAALSLTGFTSATDPQIYLGTATAATLSGAITLPAAQASYRFAGYKGGQLTVQSALSDGAGARAVVIGDAGQPATFTTPGLFGSARSAVTLSGANTYTGGTVLSAGLLYVGSDTALGTGALTVGSYTANDGQHLGLLATNGARTLANAVSLGSAPLDVGGASALTLTGPITGSGTLAKVGAGMLTLAGDNHTFSGPMYVTDGSLVFQNGLAVGTGELVFNSTAGAGVTFGDNSTVYGLSGANSSDVINLTAGKTLTISQGSDASFRGTFAGSTSGLVFTGTGGRLDLSGASSFSGPVAVQSGGRVGFANGSAFGAATNVVTVSAGELFVASGVTLSNPMTFSTGILSGNGTFRPPAGSTGYAIGHNGVVAPGYAGAGTLTFDGGLLGTSVLLLNSGGTYRWGLQDAANGAGGWGQVVVNGGVTFGATSADPFTITLLSLTTTGTNGLAANFDPTQAYSWTLLSATTLTGFNPAAVTLNTGGFLNPNSGMFSLALGGSGNSLVLNFTPVPEPSTYALLLAGLGAVWAVRRRRRRA